MHIRKWASWKSRRVPTAGTLRYTLAEKLQTQKRVEEETLTRAVGARGDPAPGLRLVPPPPKTPQP